MWLELLPENEYIFLDAHFLVGYNPKWVDKKSNERGIRMCTKHAPAFGGWVSAAWIDSINTFETDDETVPTHLFIVPDLFESLNKDKK